MAITVSNFPFALSLSKGRPFFGATVRNEGQGFDKLSPNGLFEVLL